MSIRNGAQIRNFLLSLKDSSKKTDVHKTVRTFVLLKQRDAQSSHFCRVELEVFKNLYRLVLKLHVHLNTLYCRHSPLAVYL